MFTGSFLILLKLKKKKKKKKSCPGPTFFSFLAEQVHLILNEWHAIFAVKLGDSAGGESRDFCVQNIKEMCSGTGSALCCRERGEEVREEG